MTTFLKLELASSREAGDTYPPEPVLLNVEHIVRIHSAFNGSTIVATDRTLTVTTSFEVLVNLLKYTNGRVAILDGVPAGARA